jgi:transposase
MQERLLCGHTNPFMPRQEIAMQAQTVTQTAWIGIDVAKKTVDAAIHTDQPHGSVATFERTRQGMAQLACWARNQLGDDFAMRAIMEATGRYSVEAISWLLEADAAIAPACVNPSLAKHFGQSLGLRNKTDQIDARMLARMGAERSPTPYESPSPVILELRSLVRERRELVEEQTRLGNRIGEGCDSSFVKKQRDKRLRLLKGDIERIDAEIARVIAADAQLKADVALLLTIPGVGKVTAATVLAELGDLRRFASGRQLAAFAGLSPRRRESGTSVKGRTRMCKKGNPTVRSVLFMSAMTSKRMPRGMAATYDRLTGNGKKPMSAIGALMRKQLILMRALIVSGKHYESPVDKSPRMGEETLAR